MSKNRRPTESQIIRGVERTLTDSFPPDWTLQVRFDVPEGDRRVDVLVEVRSPAGDTAALVIETKRVIEPRDIGTIADRTRDLAEGVADGIPIVAAAYLSPRSRSILDDRGVGYLDTTGNVRIRSASPGLFIWTRGADRDPWPQPHGLQSLRGRGSGRSVRAVVDFAPPFGIRELAAASDVSLASLVRVIDLLGRDNLIAREPRGPITAVDWKGTIQRWSEDYGQLRSNTVSTYLEPRGFGTLGTNLTNTGIKYAATGAFAAQGFDPIAPARTAAVYVEDPEGAAEILGLRETDAGSNVTLLEPYDPVVFDRTIERGGLVCVAPSQLAVDLLTGPGREPSQGDEILEWMERNEHVWRT